jgi:iron complex transport system ATP-binding protein
MNSDDQILLETCNLAIGYTKKTGEVLFSDLNISLKKGTLNCLMGPNGSGKSTLLKTLTGLMKPIKGEIRYSGDAQLLKKPLKRAKTFSVVLTGNPHAGLLRVRELVAIGRHPHTGWAGNYNKKDLEMVQWALSAVRAGYLADRMVHTLSDGERQRVMVARALAQETPIIFLDEPTAYLDLPHKIELMHIFRKLTHRCGLTLLMSTHDLELSLQYADNLCLLGERQCSEFGSPEDLLLEGKLEQIFDNHELDFDRERGVFHAKTNFHTLVNLQGHPVAVKWTRNALEKMGIGVTDNQDARFEIRVSCNGTNESYIWKYQSAQNAGESHSVSELMVAMKECGLSNQSSLNTMDVD